MNLAEQLKEEYLKQCEDYCNHGGYTRLESERKNIRERVIEEYGINDNKEIISRQVMICEKIVFDYLEKLTEQKFKHYMWIPDFLKKELIDKLNIALQPA